MAHQIRFFEDREPDDSSWLFVADNVDHNTMTIGGKETFHGVGLIAALTLGIKRSYLVNRKKNVGPPHNRDVKD